MIERVRYIYTNGYPHKNINLPHTHNVSPTNTPSQKKTKNIQTKTPQHTTSSVSTQQKKNEKKRIAIFNRLNINTKGKW